MRRRTLTRQARLDDRRHTVVELGTAMSAPAIITAVSGAFRRYAAAPSARLSATRDVAGTVRRDPPKRSVRERVAGESGIGLIEVIAATAVLSVGMMAIAGISLQVGTQNNLSTSQTDQSLAAQQVMEDVRQMGFANVTNGSDTLTVGNRTYSVTRTVTTPSNRVKLVQLTVVPISGIGSPRVYSSRIYQTRQLPAPPGP